MFSSVPSPAPPPQQNVCSRMVFSGISWKLLHTFRMRISPTAQWEVRGVCVRMLELVYPFAPNVFGDLRTELTEKHPAFFEGIG